MKMSLPPQEKGPAAAHVSGHFTLISVPIHDHFETYGGILLHLLVNWSQMALQAVRYYPLCHYADI